MPLRRVAGQPTFLLSRANARAQGILQRGFADAGVRGYHYRLMAALEEYGDLSQADLSRRTWIDPKDVVHALNDLVDRGVAQRRADPADRRRNLVTLTDAGRAELLRLDAVLARVQDEVLAPLTASERRQLVGLLRKLSSASTTG